MADGSVKIDITADDSDVKQKLKDVEDAAEDTSDSLDDLGDGAGKGSKGLGLLDVAAGNLVAGGISSLIGGLGDAVQSLLNLSEETREFREDMAKLKTAFSTTGHDTEEATKAYEDFYAILGESDRSVEAVNHLAELTDNTEELSKWSTIAAGVTAKFGDSLPIEGLTEAANETAKVGAVTGPLADALNWAGISEDKFNESLAKCNSEQERATLITNTLNDTYSAAATEYNTLTASTQAARRATAEYEQKQAELGAAIEPFTTKLTEAKTEFIDLGINIANNILGLSTAAEKTNAYTAELREMKLASDESAIGISEQFNYTNSLANELMRLADNTGVVQEADRARAEFILGELNSALGTEYSMTGNIINNYQSIKDSIYQVIEAKKAQILLAEYEDVYAESIKNVTAHESERAQAALEIANAQAELEEAEKKLTDAIEESTGKRGMLSQVDVDTARVSKIEKERLLEEQIAKYNDLNTAVDEDYSAINAYEQASTLILQGETDKAIDILNDYGNGFNDAAGTVGEATKKELETLKNKVISTSVQLGLLEAEYKEKQGSMTDAEKKEMEKRIENAKKQAQDAREEYKTVGGEMVSGMTKGVEDGEWSLTGAMKSLVDKAIQAAKDAAIIKSPSHVTRDEVGLMLAEGAAEGVTLGQKAAITSIQSLTKAMIAEMVKGANAEVETLEKKYEELSELRNKDNAETIDAQKKLVKKELDIAKERAKNLESYEKTLTTQLNKYTTLQEDYAKGVERIQDNLTNDINSAVDAYETAFENQYKSIKNSLSLFAEAEKGESVKGTDLTKNLKSQITVLEDYNEALNNLSNKGLNQAFVDELKGMGVDALPQLEALNKMTDKQLTEYVGLWEEKNALALSATQSVMSTQEKETLTEIESLKNNAILELEGLQTNFRTDLIALTEEVSLGMKETGEAGLVELSGQIDNYTQVGRDLMEGVAEGISQRESQVISMLVNGVRNAIDAAKKEADIHSPSNVTKKELGENLALGVGEGWEEKINLIKNTISGSMADVIERARATVAGEQARFSGMSRNTDTGYTELLQAVGNQTAGINSLAHSYTKGTANQRPIIIQLNERELGRAIVDVGGIEETRIGAHLAFGGAR
jgi:hypothetical protein